jgi:hypothetical protein
MEIDQFPPTREQMDQAQRQDNEERRQRAEEAFSKCFIEWDFRWKGITIPDLVETGSPHDWAVIAAEMGLTSLYKRLKEGK